MKIIELIIETEDHIKTFWSLAGIDVDRYIQIYNRLKQTGTNISFKGNYLQLYSNLDSLLRDSRWGQLEHDPDYERVYKTLLDIFTDVTNILKHPT